MLDRIPERFRTPTADKSHPHIVVIGGGISGISSAVELHKRGLRPLLLDRAAALGGLWSRAGHPSQYRPLVQNTYYRDMAFDDAAPAVPAARHHFSAEEYTAYLERYASAHLDPERVLPGCWVSGIARNADDTATLHLHAEDGPADGGITLDADYVVYAGGTSHRPHLPDLPGIESYAGQLAHFSDLADEGTLTGKDVLIVGFGNTAADLAYRLHGRSRSVTISARNTTWVVPRTIDGVAIDKFVQGAQAKHGAGYTRVLYQDIMRAGGYLHGEPTDEVDFTKCRIVINEKMLPVFRDGAVALVPELLRIDQGRTVFADGSTGDFDAILFCTGYASQFPRQKGFRLGVPPLLANMVHRDWDRLYFVGTQPIWGSAGRAVKKQARAVATLIAQPGDRDALVRCIEATPQINGTGIVLGYGDELLSSYDYNCRMDAILARFDAFNAREASASRRIDLVE